MKEIEPLSGDEAITIGGRHTLATVSDFWRWSYSSLNMPTVRGDFAEYLVFMALKASDQGDIGVPADFYQTRMGWDMVDLTYGYGIVEAYGKDYFCPSTAHGWGLEVKSSSTKNVSNPRFDVKLKNGYHVPSRRVIKHLRNWSDIYVFALLTDESHQTSMTDVRAWTFYLLPTFKLDALRRDTKKAVRSIAVPTLLKIGAVVSTYLELRTRMQELIDCHYEELSRWKFAHNDEKLLYCSQLSEQEVMQIAEEEEAGV